MPSRFPRLRAGLTLLRPLNLVLALIGVGVGALLSGTPAARLPSLELGLAMLSVAGLGAGANALNDVFDIDIDRLNRPNRPLPSGLVSRGQAVGLGVGATLLGLGTSLALSPRHACLAAGAAALLWAYNVRLKRTPLAGNLVVAVVVALALPFGAWAVGPIGLAGVGAVFAGLTTLAREMVKDIEDHEGDAAAQARTLAVVWGPHRAGWAALGVIGCTVALTPLPYVLLGVRPAYLALVLAADAALLASALTLAPPAPDPHGSSRHLKAAMLAGLTALAFA